MTIPEHSSDHAIAFACNLCLGRGKIGYGTAPTPCPKCAATGWTILAIQDLTTAEAETIRQKLAAIPPDSDAEYYRESTCDNITKMLANFLARHITFPAGEAREIHLTDARKNVLKIFPEFRGGCYHNLNVIPEPILPDNSIAVPAVEKVISDQ